MLPIALIYLGVFGGIFAFGFMGIILGPVLIAVGIAMSKTWLSLSASMGNKDEPNVETLRHLEDLSVNSINADVSLTQDNNYTYDSQKTADRQDK